MDGSWHKRKAHQVVLECEKYERAFPTSSNEKSVHSRPKSIQRPYHWQCKVCWHSALFISLLAYVKIPLHPIKFYINNISCCKHLLKILIAGGFDVYCTGDIGEMLNLVVDIRFRLFLKPTRHIVPRAIVCCAVALCSYDMRFSTICK